MAKPTRKKQIAWSDKKMQKFLRKIVRKGKKVNDYTRSYVGLIQSFIFADIINHFEEEEGGPNKDWPFWSDSYMDHMINVGKFTNKILQDTGNLRQNFKPTNWRATQKGLVFFNDAKTKDGFPYAAAHNNPPNIRPKLPRRRFMWLSSKARRMVLATTVEFMVGKKGK